jgi:hypothetical protein
VGVGVGAELHLLHLDRLLLLLGLGLALLRLVLVLAEVHDLADGGRRVGGDLDEIEADLFCKFERALGFDDADILTFGADQADLWGADASVDAGAGIARGRRVVRSAGYCGGPSVVEGKLAGR